MNFCYFLGSNSTPVKRGDRFWNDPLPTDRQRFSGPAGSTADRSLTYGQYFIAVNVSKKEYVTAWEIGGVAKLWEWCANHWAGIFPYLLRKSDESGGGDLKDFDTAKYAGRWAGDKVYLVGDYDSSKLYERAKKHFANIAKELVQEYNQFIAATHLKLKYEPMKG